MPAVVYSPLCNNNPALYLAYLFALYRVGDGRGIEQLVSECGGDGGRASGSGGDGDGVALASIFRDVCASEGFKRDGLVVGRTVGGGDCRISGLVECSGSKNSGRDAGLAGDSVGGPVGGVDRDSGAGVVGNDGASAIPGNPRSRPECGVHSGGRVVPDAVDLFPGLHGAARRKAKVRAKRAARGVLPAVGRGNDGDTPEWRRGAPLGAIHNGYFSGCSSETQRELRESRAQMMIARNKAATTHAEISARRAAALVQSQLVERQAELRRLELDAKVKSAAEAKYGVDYSSGFAETVLSAGLSNEIPVPSVASSPSPDSSVSVAAVRRMEAAIAGLSQENAEYKRRLAALECGEAAGASASVTGAGIASVEVTGTSVPDYVSDYHDGHTGYVGSDVDAMSAIWRKLDRGELLTPVEVRRRKEVEQRMAVAREKERRLRVLEAAARADGW